MKKNFIDKIGLVVIILTVILLNIFIGSNIKDPIWIIQTIISIFTVIYLVVKKLKKEKHVIIKGKIDIAVLIFMISTTIPLIFKTYASLNGTINFILKYWSVYGMYVLVRNIITDNKKIKLILNTFIISSIIPIIFGYDKFFNLNIFQPFLDMIKAVKIEDYRMISTFGYANTYAAYLGVMSAFAIAMFFNSEKKINKILYAIYTVIAGITIILTQSKFVIALLALIIFVFIIIGTKKKKISKKWIILGIIAVIAFFIYFFIAINIAKPVEVEEERNLVIRGIESNTNYKLDFDIEAVSDKEYDSFDIKIIEVTRYLTTETIGKISFGNSTGNKEINITTGEDIDHLEILVTNKSGQKITINDFKINGERYILEYKIIPDALVRMFTTFNFKNSSVWQRVDFWMDGLDIIKENWLLGVGGNAWRMLYGQVQDYLYYAKEAHCYILEVWMSFGIIGIISYVFIVAISIKNLMKTIKERKENYIIQLSVIVGTIIIFLHSIMDFDMSYLIIEMLFFSMIALINNGDRDIKQNKMEFIEIATVITFLLVAIFNILGFTANVLNTPNPVTSNKIAPWISKYKYNVIVYNANENIENKEQLERVIRFMETEPYQYQSTINEIFIKNIEHNIEKEGYEANKDYIDFIIKYWTNVKIERPYEITQIQDRMDNMSDMLNVLEEIYEKDNNEEVKKKMIKIINIVENLYEKNSKSILDYRKTGEGKGVSKLRYNTFNNTYINILKIKEKLSK